MTTRRTCLRYDFNDSDNVDRKEKKEIISLERRETITRKDIGQYDISRLGRVQPSVEDLLLNLLHSLDFYMCKLLPPGREDGGILSPIGYLIGQCQNHLIFSGY